MKSMPENIKFSGDTDTGALFPAEAAIRTDLETYDTVDQWLNAMLLCSDATRPETVMIRLSQSRSIFFRVRGADVDDAAEIIRQIRELPEDRRSLDSDGVRVTLDLTGPARTLVFRLF